jgi:hypothetical protein
MVSLACRRLGRSLRRGGRGATAGRELVARPPAGSSWRGRRKRARGAASGMEFGARPPGIGARTTLGDREVKNTDVQRLVGFFSLGRVGFAMKSGPYREPVVDSYSTTGFSIDEPYACIYIDSSIIKIHIYTSPEFWRFKVPPEPSPSPSSASPLSASPHELLPRPRLRLLPHQSRLLG